MPTKLSYLEFYITNFCNIDCAYCNRFNNYNFRGHMEYEPYLADFEKWSKIIQLEDMVRIMGGEPLLHPDLEGWIRTIRHYWPDIKTFRLSSNGTMLYKTKNLYNIIKDNRVELDIAVHNFDWLQSLIDNLKDFFPGPFTIEEFPEDNIHFKKLATDQNGVKIFISKYNSMSVSTVFAKDSMLTVHDSDPVQAHKVCTMKYCHHMINGKIYKCGVEGLIKDFSQQMPLSVTQDQQSIIDGPTGMSAQQALDNPGALMKYLKSPIEHCKLCPEKLHFFDISANIGKTKIPIILAN